MITPLAQAGDPAAFGGKAAGLAKAVHAGLPVPSGIALRYDVVDRIAVGDHAAFSQALAAAERLGPYVAVRSSAVGEDGADASFAGQHTTMLGVPTDAALEAAITAVHSSGRSPSASAYRSRLGVAGPVRMAVVLQQIVDAECAGVLFTRNPVTHADERVIEASYGFGEAVVGGMVVPDEYRLSRGGAVLSSRVGLKDIAIRPAATGGTIEVDIDADSAARLCLTPQRLAALDYLATRCEAAFAGALDIEWAFAESALYLLQCRSVTR
ncbi:PEP/pyruvate-binding domain-containing protein [Antrihabitans stalactiti]|uniref:Pyruvate phosphate dikinase AMP/ATP-binding domain-containing protein n=1 Tax=Antrihabitans stalactiti TaxID=2584121 RepID=A0A848KFA1_9NOCA|nr:PEP/pyruvate-binding domain-containing protein [Antrihabitans stalactiti]NMN97475.1 hypothetical protein [Antrihabitans stalactiti]